MSFPCHFFICNNFSARNDYNDDDDDDGGEANLRWMTMTMRMMMTHLQNESNNHPSSLLGQQNKVKRNSFLSNFTDANSTHISCRSPSLNPESHSFSFLYGFSMNSHSFGFGMGLTEYFVESRFAILLFLRISSKRCTYMYTQHT